jgi:hypothetical protein
MYRLIWVFQNDHKWEKTFSTREAAQAYAESIGLSKDPNIIHFEITEGAA